MTYFRNIKSFSDLKARYRELLKANHPDNGGDEEVMKAINCEFDALFAVWKLRADASDQTAQTASDVRNEFYTEFGWKGSNHDWRRTLKEIAQIVRAYVKEKYPTYKFSVRTEYASMCQELHVTLKESPVEIYKTYDELTDDDKSEIMRLMKWDGLWNKNSWYESELKEAVLAAWEGNGAYWYKVPNELTSAVVQDVDAFVNSYNYHDCDGRIDYFDVDFYYFGCLRDNGREVKIVPKSARLKVNNELAKGNSASTPAASGEIEYEIVPDVDTRDDSKIWVVKIKTTLSREEFAAERERMKARGAYYSRYKRGFLFRCDPSEKLKAI